MSKISPSKFWNDLKEYYRTTFRLSGRLVNLMSNMDIALLSVSGACNKNIAVYFDLTEGEVADALKETLGFYGLHNELDFNPRLIYKKVEGSANQRGDFLAECQKYQPDIMLSFAEKLYELCEKYEKLDSELEQNWN